MPLHPSFHQTECVAAARTRAWVVLVERMAVEERIGLEGDTAAGLAERRILVVAAVEELHCRESQPSSRAVTNARIIPVLHTKVAVGKEVVAAAADTGLEELHCRESQSNSRNITNARIISVSRTKVAAGKEVVVAAVADIDLEERHCRKS